MTTSFRGYLNDTYLDNPYDGDEGYDAWGMQVKRQIVDAKKPIGQQVKRQIVDFKKPIGMQCQRIINSSKALGQQVKRQIVDFKKPIGMQVKRQIVDFKKAIGQQVQRIINSTKALGQQINRITSISTPRGMQVKRQIVDSKKTLGIQTTRIVINNKNVAMQVKRILNKQKIEAMQIARFIVDSKTARGMNIRTDKSFPHTQCLELGYLEESYLSDPYLIAGFCVAGPMQVKRQIVDFKKANAQQVRRVINAQKARAMQVSRHIVDHKTAYGMQISLLRSTFLGMQVRKVLYNTNNLRVMLDFPSRGLSGLNWTSTSTASGDFSPNNLNTDIVEQVWRSVDGTTSVTLTSDTEIVQGAAIDTLALLNHNLTTSASITVEGSLNNFSTVNASFVVSPTKTDAYYIAPLFPNTQSSKWRIIISDPTNPEGRLEIGTIVYGTTIILQGECFVDQVTRTIKHFADKVATEGFTNVSNDRAIKRAVGMDFRRIQYARGNYKNLRDLFDTARTSLKCLWIPDPQKTDRFSVFAKLVTIPVEKHQNMGDEADFVDFAVDVDESL